MDIEASATCKYLKPAARKIADLRDQVCTLKLVAQNRHDGQILTAIYNLYLDGGHLEINSHSGAPLLKAIFFGRNSVPALATLAEEAADGSES